MNKKFGVRNVTYYVENKMCLQNTMFPKGLSRSQNQGQKVVNTDDI